MRHSTPINELISNTHRMGPQLMNRANQYASFRGNPICVGFYLFWSSNVQRVNPL